MTNSINTVKRYSPFTDCGYAGMWDLDENRGAYELESADFVTHADYAALEAQSAAQAARIEQLTAENVKLQEQAARELSGSWIMEKLASSAQAAAFCLEVDIPSSRKEALSWLDWCAELFTDPLPDDMTISKLNEWYTAQMRGSLSFDEALKVIKSQSPETTAALREIRARAVESAADWTGDWINQQGDVIKNIREYAKQLRSGEVQL